MTTHTIKYVGMRRVYLIGVLVLFLINLQSSYSQQSSDSVPDRTTVDGFLDSRFELRYPRLFNLDDTLFTVGSALIEDVLFSFDEVHILESSFAFLDSLAVLLINNDSLIIEIRIHTDSRGSVDYNRSLSSFRAKEIMEYLISNGVDGISLTAKGMGESDLIVSSAELDQITDVCFIEKLHALNRRTEFLIVETDHIE